VTADAIAADAVDSGAVVDGSLAAGDLNASNPQSNFVLGYDDSQPGDLVWQDPAVVTSSERFKNEIETIQDAQALVDQLRGVRFQWTADGRADIGLIAEEVAQVLPELVTYETDGTTVRGVRYAPLVAVLIEALQVQQAALDTAQQRAQDQQDQLDALSDRLHQIEVHLDTSSPR
jgi:hypothetical protein